MTLTHTIDDLEGFEFVVDFEFHKELDGMIVFDGAWSVISVLDADGIGVEWWDLPKADQMVHRWLAVGGEDRLYTIAERELKYA